MEEPFIKMRLVIGNETKSLNADYAIRFVEKDGKSYPSLYYKGKRVIDRWMLLLNCSIKADPYGKNANTADKL